MPSILSTKVEVVVVMICIFPHTWESVMYGDWMPSVLISANLDGDVGYLTSRTRDGSSG
jgi:hypothetical protein